MKYTLDAFPAIGKIYHECTSENGSWFNSFSSESYKEALDEFNQAYKILAEVLGRISDIEDNEAMESLRILEDAQGMIQSELCGMAFVEGFRQAQQLARELSLP